MGERIRHASIYMKGRKVATATNNNYGIESGDEAQVADDGYIGHSDGAVATSLSFDTIEPVRKSDSADVEDALLKKKYVGMTYASIGGRMHEIEMRCTSAKYSSDPKTGTLTGSFEFGGGEPEVSEI